jgi:effector-binding domain-containing protein
VAAFLYRRKIICYDFPKRQITLIFHSGHYGEAELPTTAKLHSFIKENGFRKSGKLH